MTHTLCLNGFNVEYTGGLPAGVSVTFTSGEKCLNAATADITGVKTTYTNMPNLSWSSGSPSVFAGDDTKYVKHTLSGYVQVKERNWFPSTTANTDYWKW